MGTLSVWHWIILGLVSLMAAPVPNIPGALQDATAALERVTAMPTAKILIDYQPGEEGLRLYRLPGNVCFLRNGRKKVQVSWIRRDDRGRIEIIVSAPVLGFTGRRFDPDGTAQLDLAGQAVAVPVASPGFPTWRFTLEDTPALQEALDADEATLRFTAIRGGKPVPEEVLSIAAGNLWQGIQGLDSCAVGAELPGVVGP